MPELRSQLPPTSALALARRAHYTALGIPRQDWDKPKVAIVNTSSELAACYSHLDEISARLKKHLREVGLLPFEIRTTAPSDFVTSAGRAGRYILPSRDLIVNDIEAAVEGAKLDAMICLSSCDKTTPAHLMAAGRLNIPTIIVPCGYQHSGLAEGREADIEEIFMLASKAAVSGEPTDHLLPLAEDAILGPGVCAGLATANSMHMLAEAIGMTVPGAAPVRALSDKMWEDVRAAATALADLIERDVRPRDIITAGAVRNGVRTMLAVGGSMNTIKHLQAIAIESELDIDVWGLFHALGRSTPLLCSVRPNGPRLTEEFEDAGGAATVLRELLPLLDGDAITASGRTVAENAADAPAADGDVIRPVDDPFGMGPAVTVLKGSLSPGGAVAKRPVPDPGPYVFRGPACVFGTRDEAIEGIASGRLREGDVAVIRGIGVTGAPGLGLTSAFIFALHARGLADSVALVTDGQFSGLVNQGFTVGEVSPEAAEPGSPLGRVLDGDPIEIDIERGTVDLLVDPAELDLRPDYQPPADRDSAGYLTQYEQLVQPLSCGAVLCARPCAAASKETA
ncbi:dihydroxy-acid dehydratase [Pseudoclavibacter endophyticus]|uniref:Dihydroxy-acid dehydratase n=1 Tax=Pseudoclavibacter endophyticus TaxID=1778590 RepID=A0A6H9WFC8_9MICO|nr:dihydroxy-acid dehydratase [Pseudoclavibacter endophyticus]KAB1649659.1 dihydroxy-acid dehydratase [Pseudoclavibacter endophyticus]GGA60856.1 dihydroxy-acid dehydratase [Pseudoclavibacter endophyticus]